MSKMLDGAKPQTIALEAAALSDPLGVGIYEDVGVQIISGTGPLNIYLAQDDSGPFDVADETLTAAAQKTSLKPGGNVMKLENDGPDTLTVKVQGYGVKNYYGC